MDYFIEPQASELAKRRIEARKKRRIPYDCLHAIVDGDFVICGKGNCIGRATGDSMGLFTVLCGRSALVCQDCKDYDADKVKSTIIGHRVYD